MHVVLLIFGFLLPHQRYLDLIFIILLLSAYLHALALQEAETYGADAFDALVYIIDFLREDVDPVDELLVEILEVRLLSLLRSQHQLEIARHLAEALAQGLLGLRRQVGDLLLYFIGSLFLLLLLFFDLFVVVALQTAL